MSDLETQGIGDGRIPVLLLTGFLGAGKTTLLLRWLSEAPATGLRLGVVMNEFGIQSVDSQLLARPGLPLQQVTGGCICCADDNELPRAIQTLIRDGGCDYIVVETSGLADPDKVIDVLTDFDLLPRTCLQAVITVVDAEWYAQPDGGDSERILARHQIQYAHAVCLSKCDRITETERALVSEVVQRINPDAILCRLPFGLPDLQQLLRRIPASAEIDLGESGERGSSPNNDRPHLHTRYQSLAWRIPRPVDRSRFEACLSSWNSREVVRAKGFVRFSTCPDRIFVFQSVFGHHFIEEFLARPQPEPVAVLIGPQLDAEKFRAQLRALVYFPLLKASVTGLAIQASCGRTPSA